MGAQAVSDLPELTCCVLTYKRPWYGILTLQAVLGKVAYGGPKRFHIADGGSPDEQLRAYEQVLAGQKYTISVTDNLSSMLNSCAAAAGEVWFVTLDDFMPYRKFDLTPDVRFMQTNPDVGALRMGRLAFWENAPSDRIEAQLRGLGGLHWWVFNKARTNHAFICAINTTLYHRRFWDAYGDVKPCPPDNPGLAEIFGAERYNARQGPTIGVPMRFGQDCMDWQEPIWHFGTWRTDEYAAPRPQGHFG